MFYYYVTNISRQLERNNEAIAKLTETLSILMDRIDRKQFYYSYNMEIINACWDEPKETDYIREDIYFGTTKTIIKEIVDHRKI